MLARVWTEVLICLVSHIWGAHAMFRAKLRRALHVQNSQPMHMLTCAYLKTVQCYAHAYKSACECL